MPFGNGYVSSTIPPPLDTDLLRLGLRSPDKRVQAMGNRSMSVVSNTCEQVTSSEHSYYLAVSGVGAKAHGDEVFVKGTIISNAENNSHSVPLCDVLKSIHVALFFKNRNHSTFGMQIYAGWPCTIQ